MSFNFLLENFINNKSNVIKHLENAKYKSISRSYYDFLTVVPVHGRKNHLAKFIECFNQRKKESTSSHRMVLVENSNYQNSINMCVKNDIDYIFINKNKDLFNKCLSMNAGSLLHESKYIHFHDVDIWMPKNFWNKLIDNIKDKDIVQSFAGRKINYLSQEITNKIFFNHMSVEQAISRSGSWIPGRPGAPGGSIVINRELFNKVGGFDPYYFWAYSIEDQFFVDKIELFKKFVGCDNPPIEMFHLWHHSNEKSTPLIMRKNGIKIRKYFINLNNEDKLKLIKMFEEFFKTQKNIILNKIEKKSNKI
jgi:GT2 family glycosyltransferase